MKNDLVFIDTETGGLNPERDALLSVGLVRYVDGVVVATDEVLVQPEGLHVGDEALRINKIDIAQHRKVALSRRAAAARIYHWIGSHVAWYQEGSARIILGGHNVAFDVAFTRRLFGDYWSRMVMPRTLDTAAIMQFLHDAGLLEREFRSLDQGLAHFKITVDPKLRHTALGDAAATAALYGELVKLATPAVEQDSYVSGTLLTHAPECIQQGSHSHCICLPTMAVNPGFCPVCLKTDLYCACATAIRNDHKHVVRPDGVVMSVTK